MAKLIILFLLSLVKPLKIDLKEILNRNKNMDLVFSELLVRRDTPHIMLREAQDIMNAMRIDFPEVVQVKSIGKTWEGRSIDMIVIDGAE
jgi:hypothetical protein